MVKYSMAKKKIISNLSSEGKYQKKKSFPFKKTICFCGSFKFYQEMEKVADFLRKKGLQVVVPQPSHIRNIHKPEELKKDKFNEATLRKWEREGAFSHLANIRKSDLVYIFNQGSYLGPAVTVEIGYALALGKPIFARAKVKDVTVANFIKKVVSPTELLEWLKLKSLH